MDSKLINGDSLEVLKDYDENSIDLLCTDPPYGYGFMGKDWDQTLPPREIFEECLRVLKPGSFSFVMSAPRSDVQSRMVQMLEEVGFDVSFTPIYWAYATGFPKALNVGKVVDKRLGKKREVIGVDKRSDRPIGNTYQYNIDDRESSDNGMFKSGGEDVRIKDKPASDEAKSLDGSYAGFQPKPAVEVVIVAMKPLDKKGYVDQALDNQKGVTWLDDCRIPFADPSVEDKRLIEGGSWDTSKMGENIYSGGWAGKRVSSQKKKMSDKEQYESNKKGFTERSSIEEGSVYAKEYGGIYNYGFKKPISKDLEQYNKDNVGSQKNFDTEAEGLSRGNQPSRKSKSDYEKYVEKQKSFKGAKTIGNVKEGGTSFLGGDMKQLDTSTNYQRKTTKRKPREENTVFKTSGFKSEDNDTAEASPLGRFAANLLVSDDVLNDGKVRKSTGGTGDINVETKFGQTSNRIQKPFNYQDEGSFSRYYDLDAWWESRLAKLPEGVRNTFPFLIVPKASKREKNMGLDNIEKKQKIYNGQSPEPSKDMKGVERKFTTLPSQNFHPTVKPIQLFSYLVTLGSRKDDVVLDPFMGSGTTPISCVTLDRKYLGIEREKEYFEIAEARVKKAKNPANLVEHNFF